MNKSLLFLVILASVVLADNYTLSPDGQYVSWENTKVAINCTATSSELTNQQQICNFTYTGSGNPTINTSFIFNLADHVTPSRIFIWQNISHNMLRLVETPLNHTLVVTNVSKIVRATGDCEWGNGSIKRNVTGVNPLVDKETIISMVYCVDSYNKNSSTVYTLYSVYSELQEEPYVSWFYDWSDLTSLFNVTQFGIYKVGTIQTTWSPNQTRRVRIDYTTKPNTAGKYDIAFHPGSAQDLRNNLSTAYIYLDPWWNSSWSDKRCALVTSAQPATAYNFNITLWDTLAHTDIRFTTNSSGSEVQCGGWWHVQNETTGRWILNCTLAATTNICAYYTNNTPQSNLEDIQAACKLGDHFPGVTINATNWRTAGSPVVTKNIVIVTGTIGEAIYSKQLFGPNTIIETLTALNTSGYPTMASWVGACFVDSCVPGTTLSRNGTALKGADGLPSRFYVSNTSANTYFNMNTAYQGIYTNLKITRTTSNVSLYVNQTYRNSTASTIPQFSLNVTLSTNAVATGGESDWFCVYDDFNSAALNIAVGSWPGSETPITTMIGGPYSWVWGTPVDGVSIVRSGTPYNWSWHTYTPYSGNLTVNGSATSWAWVSE